MIQFFFQHKIITIIAILALSGGGYYYKNKGSESRFDTTAVSKGTLIQEVSATGSIKPRSSANLAFERSGKIKGLYTDVGKRVTIGSLLGELDNGELHGGLLDAQANLRAEESKFDELKIGAKPEEVTISKTKVTSAEFSKKDAEQNLRNNINDAFTRSDDAVRNQVDQFISNPRTSNPKLNFNIINDQLRIEILQRRVSLENIFSEWQTIVGVSISAKSLPEEAESTQNNLELIKAFLDKVALAINTLSSSGTMPQSILDGYKASVASARSSVNIAIVNMSQSQEKMRSAERALILAQEELLLKESGATKEQLSIQEARVSQAQAKIKTAEAQLQKSMLYSPISGVVTRKDARIGEIIGANQTVFSIISDRNIEIEVAIPESDITKISLGDSARISLDAYSDNLKFNAIVVRIDPAATIIEGVPTYITKLNFDEMDSRIKPGMTANIDILTEKKENVLLVPTRAIYDVGMNKIVYMPDSQNPPKEIQVETGLRSSDGRTEIISGLQEGDLIITSNIQTKL